MKALLREQAVQLRLKDELSYSEIRRKLNVSKSTLSYWLRGLPFSEQRIRLLRRQGWEKGEASRERFRLAMRKRREEKERQSYEQYLQNFARFPDSAFFLAGLTLYAAEGEKTTTSRIMLANTDVRLLRFFLSWFERYFSISQRQFKAQLHLYENMDIAKEKKFWEDALQFSPRQFMKSQVRIVRKSSFSYRESFRHGTCSLYYGSVEKKRQVMTAIQALFDQFIVS